MYASLLEPSDHTSWAARWAQFRNDNGSSARSTRPGVNMMRGSLAGTLLVTSLVAPEPVFRSGRTSAHPHTAYIIQTAATNKCQMLGTQIQQHCAQFRSPTYRTTLHAVRGCTASLLPWYRIPVQPCRRPLLPAPSCQPPCRSALF